MGFLDGYSEGQNFLKSFATLAEAAKTAANAYADKAKEPTVIVNVNYESDVLTESDIRTAVTRALRNRGVQDR